MMKTLLLLQQQKNDRSSLFFSSKLADLLQASVNALWKSREFTSWDIWKVVKIYHYGRFEKAQEN